MLQPSFTQGACRLELRADDRIRWAIDSSRCRALTALQSDAAVTHPDTLAALSLSLRQLQGAAEAALPSEHLYWLVLNATKATHMACTSLVTAGFAGAAVQRSAECWGR